MEYWKQAYDIADIVLENSWLMWIVYVSFFVLALAMRKKENRTRRIAGSVMIGAAMPGMLMSVGCLGLFVYTMVKVYQVASSKEFRSLDSSPLVRDLGNVCNTVPFTCLTLSLLLFIVLALIAVICGIVVLAKKAGRGIGVVTLLYGFALFGFFGWLLLSFFAYWAS
ncbi:MAG: hypothetical protein IKT20_06280 [Clostridiales bacterium]|nr:hypothetical protein [Clostridiales bacterium]MBR6488499.1 hypothetical protein [Clostridiales bacterium]